MMKKLSHLRIAFLVKYLFKNALTVACKWKDKSVCFSEKKDCM